MTVWIVNPFDNLPIEGSRPQRYWMMARAFARAGHAVVLWSCTFSHTRKKPRDLSPEKIAAAARELGGELILVPAPPYRTNLSCARIRSHLIFSRTWLQHARARKDKPDLLIISSPPLSLGAAARAFRAESNVPFIIDIQDAWPETFERFVPRFLLAPLRRTARLNRRAAAGITAVATRYLTLAEDDEARTPTLLAPLGIDLSRQPPEHTRVQPFRLVYLGAMGVSYDLETVLDTVLTHPDLELDVAGSGPREAALRARAAGCSRIRFHGYLDETAVDRLLAQAAIGLIPMFAASCVGIPNKLADYARAGLSVVNTLPGETAALLAETGAGVTCPTRDPKALADAVTELAHRDPVSQREKVRRLADVLDAAKIYPRLVAFAEDLLGN